ncbi:acyl carrier protein [Robbsia andropogonis]|uniref:Acyl carrier protein n=1 Tax=Robbsia andropogonis TaxID=28092 RepID=A0A0F5JV41_9BURK|nr:phosphopantetheine-binding protein [Robbsia andropogonis]KKB61723.1 acyl carrier protein [Robbsia andropogonis]MCP1120461.1 phosphopantetheine-binding protein [Robbsia andropogonis]MCP1130333.1 phosphopantetheine-binding protein [Robbsia andropogonis]
MDSLKRELKQLLIDALDLEDMTPADIDDDVPLFESDGIGLDSIDALEIGIVLRKHYGLTIAANDASTHQHFRSISTLAAMIVAARADGGATPPETAAARDNGNGETV